MTKVAVVTGASTGIGFAICRQLVHEDVFVLLTSRSRSAGEAAAEQIRIEKPGIGFFPLDVTSQDQAVLLRSHLEERFGRVDILINNAGVHHDRGVPVVDASLELFRSTLETNLTGPFILTKALLPMMRRNDYGRIVNISSGMGRLATMTGGSAAYRVSKAALNALTVIVSAETAGHNIKVNSIRPGRVATRMGSAYSTISAEEAAVNIVRLALLPDSGPTGKFFSGPDVSDW